MSRARKMDEMRRAAGIQPEMAEGLRQWIEYPEGYGDSGAMNIPVDENIVISEFQRNKKKNLSQSV